jgi:hypothetical protein
VGWTIQRTASNLSRKRREVNVPKDLDAGVGQPDANVVLAIPSCSDRPRHA